LHDFINVSLTLLLAVLSYRVKDVRALCLQRGLRFVTTTTVVAVLGWSLAAASMQGRRQPLHTTVHTSAVELPASTQAKGAHHQHHRIRRLLGCFSHRC
jgi:hypothetical protein